MKRLIIFVNHRQYRLYLFIFIVIWIVSSLGCASVNRLREAQDAFNQAAAAENAQRLDTNSTVAMTNFVNIKTGYERALFSLDKVEPKDEKEFKQDKLWGSVLTLKALCYWRLGLFEKVLETVNEANRTAADQLFPRDQAILKALPGLIKTDQAYRKILDKNPMPEIAALLTGPKGAVADIESARASVEKDHPIQIYLIQAQLAAYRNYQEALFQLDRKPIDSVDMAKVKSRIKEMGDLIQMHNPGPAAPSIKKHWQELFGIAAL